MTKAIVLTPGEGETLRAAGTTTTFKVKSEETNGRFSFAEYQLPPRFGGPPPHVHREFEHAWYVLSGELQVQLGEETMQMGPGAFVYVPKGVPHTFANPGSEPVRMIAIDTPGGLEPYYEELADAFAPGSTPDAETIAAIQRRYDTYPPL
jgi:mannose-6-phosphate isomerase-like protein (cupin superfamily)